MSDKTNIDCRVVNSPKKRTNLFCLLFCFSRQTKQIRSFAFLENLRRALTAFGFIWPLISRQNFLWTTSYEWKRPKSLKIIKLDTKTPFWLTIFDLVFGTLSTILNAKIFCSLFNILKNNINFCFVITKNLHNQSQECFKLKKDIKNMFSIKFVFIWYYACNHIV